MLAQTPGTPTLVMKESRCSIQEGVVCSDVSRLMCCVGSQSKEGVQCFTDGCRALVKLAVELQTEAGYEVHRREMLRMQVAGIYTPLRTLACRVADRLSIYCG